MGWTVKDIFLVGITSFIAVALVALMLHHTANKNHQAETGQTTDDTSAMETSPDKSKAN